MELRDVEELEANLMADLVAIRRVRELLTAKQQTSKVPPRPARPATLPERPAPSEPASRSEPAVSPDLFGDTVESRVLSVIERIDGHFTYARLTEMVENAHPGINPNTISGILFKYRDTKVRVVQPGRGRRGAVYERIK